MLAAAVKTGDLLAFALVALAVFVGVRGYRRPAPWWPGQVPLTAS